MNMEGTRLTKRVEGYVLDSSPRRVLVFNPPVYDTRFPWSNWQQPISLLQLGTLLRRYGCDVRLIDTLYTKSDESLTRRRIRTLTREEISINYWRFGKLPSEILAQLEAFHREGWQPDEVCIE